LVMLEPSALPMARVPDPDRAAVALTNISGALVPSETMVMPIIKGDIPKCLAVAAAPKTNRSALQTRIMRPTRMAKLAVTNEYSLKIKDVAHSTGFCVPNKAGNAAAIL